MLFLEILPYYDDTFEICLQEFSCMNPTNPKVRNDYKLASSQALFAPCQLNFMCGKKKEGESLEDFGHVLNIDDILWTQFLITGW